MKKKSFIIALSLLGWTSLLAGSMEEDFTNPPTVVSPYVWWHWMGPNISKEGITKDLEAMSASNIGGATIFHLTSTDHEGKEKGKRGIANLPFPDITFRSPKWWEMMTFAVSEAQRLGLELGMHNCPGYSATGGPWITPELSMQKVVFTKTQVKGGETFNGILPQPKATLGFYRDIAVIAIPETDPVDPKAVLDLSSQMDKDFKLNWKASSGTWTMYRFGHTSTASAPCPVPDGLQALEVDKMSASASKFHFEQVINPLREHFGSAMGKTFRHLTFDSYEAGSQNWTPAFRDEFIKRKGYDPVRWLPLLDTKYVVIEKRPAEVPVCVLGTPEQSARFLWDFKDVIAQLYQQNNFEQGARMILEAGLQLQFEGYGGPFDPIAASAIADIPMGEFWSASSGEIGVNIVGSARAVDRRIVAAEALTGKPDDSKFSEDPAFLKITGDGAFVSGVNRLVLHHWVHQPFGDAFKPGMGMGWWGTHFGRNQTWAEPGKAYYRYLARAQSLLQRGQGIGVYLTLDFAVANADAIPRAALLRGDVRVDQGQIVLPSGRRYPFLTLPKSETMLPEVARKLKEIVSKGAVIVGQKPVRSPGLSGFPGCDDEVQKIASELWGETDGRNKIENNVGKGKVFTQNANLLNKCKIVPAVTFVEQGPRKARATARQDGETAIFFISNTSDSFYEATPSFHVVGKQPEIWQAEDGSYSDAPLWREVSGRTEVPLRLRGKESVFVIFRKPAPRGDHLVALQADTGAKTWNVEVNSKGVPVIAASSALSGVALWSSGNIVHFLLSPPLPVIISGAWDVSFAPGMGAPDKIVFPDLKSWSENSVPAIKYFSGTATYRKTIDIPAEFSSKSKRVILDLGAVSNLAAVKVNGIDFGVSWYAPFQLDISAALKPGQNKLEIIVTNTWANRMIGDEQEPEDMEWGPKRTHFSDFTGRSLLAFPDWFVKGQPRPSQGRKTFTTWNYFKKDSPLLPAGLLGPVTLRAMDEIGVLNCNLLQAQDFESKPADPFFAHVAPVKAPVATGLYLKTGDRLAICGDSITAQKIYSKFIETYLTVCVPELKITVRQFGRNGETTTGFLKNMTNDCLRFKPTIATTCYGMNDYGYNPYSDSRGKSYRDNYTAVAKVFKGIGARVVLGSPGCVGKVASWVKSATGTLDEHNQSLCKFRNIAIEIAKQEEIRFADVFWPMFTAGFTAKQKYSPEYEIAGKDGVHPGWAGHLVMAYSFLKAMGLDGEIGTFTVDLKAGQAAATAGHRMDDFKNGVITVTSSRYPFCASGDPKQDNSIRSGMMLVPFNQDLNRLLLVVTNGVAAKYKVTWGTESRSYSASELAAGVNLAADFAVNPFSKAFAKVDAAVLLNQEYKTKQVQAILRGAEGKADMEAAVKRTEAERAPLAAAIANAFVPVTHTIRIEAE